MRTNPGIVRRQVCSKAGAPRTRCMCQPHAEKDIIFQNSFILDFGDWLISRMPG
jgi:hypothetical protein